MRRRSGRLAAAAGGRWYLTQLLSSELAVLAVAGGLLVIEAGVLGLDGCQAQLDGLVKQLPKGLEPTQTHRAGEQRCNEKK